MNANNLKYALLEYIPLCSPRDIIHPFIANTSRACLYTAGNDTHSVSFYISIFFYFFSSHIDHVAVRMQLFISSLVCFSGSDIVQWMIKNLDIEDQGKVSCAERVSCVLAEPVSLSHSACSKQRENTRNSQP